MMFLKRISRSKSWKVRFMNPAVTVEVQRGQTVLSAALAAGIRVRHSCRVGSCGTCRCKVIEGRIRMLTDSSYVLSADELDAGYVLACQSVPKSDATIELSCEDVLSEPPAVSTIRGTLASVQPLTRSVYELRVDLNVRLQYQAGQHVELRLPSIEGHRSFSLVGTSGSEGAMTVALHVAAIPGGRFSSWMLSGKHSGVELEVRGPFGTFGWPTELDSPVLCVGSGSSLGAFYSIFTQAMERNLQRKTVFIYAARTREDLYWIDKIEALTTSWSQGFSFIPVLSREPANSSWTGQRGRPHDILRQQDTSRFRQWRILVCGSPRMVDAVSACLRAEGIDPGRIAYDKFDPSHVSHAAMSGRSPA